MVKAKRGGISDRLYKILLQHDCVDEDRTTSAEKLYQQIKDRPRFFCYWPDVKEKDVAEVCEWLASAGFPISWYKARPENKSGLSNRIFYTLWRHTRLVNSDGNVDPKDLVDIIENYGPGAILGIRGMGKKHFDGICKWLSSKGFPVEDHLKEKYPDIFASPNNSN